jgi:hypothetical protein
MLLVVNAEGDTVEATGDQLARQVLSSGEPAMVDLRAQRGVGVDAVDELRQFYGLRVYRGAEPDEVRLTDSEVGRARANAGFFLVVVSGVGSASAEHQVRVIPQPLEQLHQLDQSGNHLAGVRSTNGPVYRPTDRDEN